MQIQFVGHGWLVFVDGVRVGYLAKPMWTEEHVSVLECLAEKLEEELEEEVGELEEEPAE